MYVRSLRSWTFCESLRRIFGSLKRCTLFFPSNKQQRNPPRQMMVTIPRSSPRSCASASTGYIASGLHRNRVVMALLTLVLLLLLTIGWQQATVVAVSTAELVTLIRDLKGTDDRIMRWDATEHTAERQAKGACEKLSEVTAMLVKEKDDTRLRLGCEYLTWCITDNPVSRCRVRLYSRPIRARTHAFSCLIPFISAFLAQRNTVPTCAIQQARRDP